ncbi:hypothetical protein D3C80_841300 [compost metagenome]
MVHDQIHGSLEYGGRPDGEYMLLYVVPVGPEVRDGFLCNPLGQALCERCMLTFQAKDFRAHRLIATEQAADEILGCIHSIGVVAQQCLQTQGGRLPAQQCPGVSAHKLGGLLRDQPVAADCHAQ